MKTLKACNFEGFLNIVAIKRISSEHNRKKFFKVLDLIADTIENGQFPRPSSGKTQKLPEEINTNESNFHINNERKENDVPSPFQKKEKLRKENDFEERIFKIDKESVDVMEHMKDDNNIIADTSSSSASQLEEKLSNLQGPIMTERDELKYDCEGNDALSESCEKMKNAVPTPFRSSRPREIGENAPVHVISSPSRFFQDFLEKSGYSNKSEPTKNSQNTIDIQDQLQKTHRESHPPRRKINLFRNELKKLKKVNSVDESRKQVGQHGKSNSLVEKNENLTFYDVKDSLRRSSLDKENELEANQQEWTPKKTRQSHNHVVQTSPIVRATDPSRGVNSWMKAQNILEEMMEEVIQIVNCIDISYQVFPILLKNDTVFLPLIESKLEEFNDSLQNLKLNLEESMKDVNQYLERSENISRQRDIAGFIKEITDEYSSPSIQSLPHLQHDLESLRQDYFQIQSQNALALVLYVDETEKELTWYRIEEAFLEYEQLESQSNGFLGLKEMLLPRNLILSFGKRLEKIIHKKSLYKKSAYSVIM
ncbi:hypothetical protein Gasu2_35100 [Galdieria sulphuraria]|nr:hypothetical protein Gasu2_35100 [Galdieria sulphuraria]